MESGNLLDVLKQHAIYIIPIYNSGWQREGSQWLKANQFQIGDRVVSSVKFGDFSRQLSKSWQSLGDEKLSQEEKAELEKQLDIIQKEYQAELEKLWKEKADEIRPAFDTLPGASSQHPYLTRKDVAAIGLRQIAQTNTLIVPMRDTGGNLWNIQRILPHKIKLSRTGELADKFFTQDARIDGLFHCLIAEGKSDPFSPSRHREGNGTIPFPAPSLDLGERVEGTSKLEPLHAIERAEVRAGAAANDAEMQSPREASNNLEGHVRDGAERMAPNLTFYLAEGYATAASIYQALEKTEHVICTFNAGNLPKAAREIRAAYPDARIIICADNDQWKPEKGNAGVSKAQASASEIGAEVVVPYFPDEYHESKPTDFNDMHALMGLNMVRAQVLGTYDPTIIKPIVTYDKAGKAKAPGEWTLVQALLKIVGTDIVKQGEKDFFVYYQGFWNHLGKEAPDFIKQKLARLMGETQSSKALDAAFKLFSMHCPRPPTGVDMFRPEFMKVNFLNGTLHALSKPGEETTLVFRDHNQADYLTSKLGIEFPGLDKLETIRNDRFEEFLAKVFTDDEDCDQKIHAISQMFGAALMPCYSQIFLLIGKRGSGKSTIIKVLKHLIGKKNIAGLDPSMFNAQNLLNMVGKTVNIVTDINTVTPIQDDIVKQIIDRADFFVKRKYLDDIYAPLPPVHIFGGNDMPKSLDGATGAYERRMLILKTGKHQVSESNFDWDFDEQLWNHSPEGVLAFAIRGLVSLLKARGHFARPASARVEMERWNLQSDSVGQFLGDLMDGNVKDTNNTYGLADYNGPQASGKIERGAFYACYVEWFKETNPHGRVMGKHTFFKILNAKDFEIVTVRGVRYFKNPTITVSDNSLI